MPGGRNIAPAQLSKRLAVTPAVGGRWLLLDSLMVLQRPRTYNRWVMRGGAREEACREKMMQLKNYKDSKD